LDDNNDSPVVIMDDWLQFPALDNLQELEFNCGRQYEVVTPPPLLLSVHHFTSTVASFSCCDGFLDGDNTNALQLLVLKQLTLSRVIISDRFMLAGCPCF
jgi:hypothetical protein